MNLIQPVPQDRINFFSAIDRDPRSELYPRNGWWIYVDKVELRPDGWIAELMTTVRFNTKRCYW